MELKQFKIHILPLRSRLYGYALRLTENDSDAEDIVQEAMIKLWNMRNKLDEYNSVEALAVKMTHNLCMDLWRRKRPDTLSVEQIVLQSETQTPEKLLEQKDEIAIMKEIIASLPPLQQTIIRMKDIEEYEICEIMEITGCNNEAIRSNLSRARKKVRDMYLQVIQEKKRRSEV
ncbi:RNA polymerase sigma factor [Bacteroides sp. 519]|uniref:RNA polymerase sigma factor n=1 Tax=Bacteroides sp. 519 TaxID=2302937 RepID=UPI0013D13CBE|nr:sigma-70 family RNA polymerase sigma factor [Bacteroides sp. 519]NDV59383.1 sigma-70 family RNA polymerase sigma factor [Bacteroides sp. 519]